MEDSHIFYDQIAGDYNLQMTAADEQVRALVMSIFKKELPEGTVLDFGGGTGLDLNALIQTYRVYFLEPSAEMRRLAKEAIPDLASRPIFLEKKLDFREWTKENLPFEEKMNGILANFAVLNCIRDLPLLFEKLALLADSSCRVLATVLDTRTSSILKTRSPGLAWKRFLNRPVITRNRFRGTEQEVYWHTLKDYKKASAPYFHFVSYTPLHLSPFALIKMTRK